MMQRTVVLSVQALSVQADRAQLSVRPVLRRVHVQRTTAWAQVRCPPVVVCEHLIAIMCLCGVGMAYCVLHPVERVRVERAT